MKWSDKFFFTVMFTWMLCHILGIAFLGLKGYATPGFFVNMVAVIVLCIGAMINEFYILRKRK